MKYAEYGEMNSKVMIFLHGGGLSFWNFEDEAKLLANEYHVILPVLDGHENSDTDFTSIEDNADEILEFIDQQCNGHVYLLGGLSLGAQIVLEILSKRTDVTDYAIIESAQIGTAKGLSGTLKALLQQSHKLISKPWFSKLQFKYLHIRPDLYDAYYTSSTAISKKNLVTFTQASAAYTIKPELLSTEAKVAIFVGAKETPAVRTSAYKLHQLLPKSSLNILNGLYHGEFSINYPKQYVKQIQNMINQD